MFSSNRGWTPVPLIGQGSADGWRREGLVWAEGRLTMVGGGVTVDDDELRVATLEGNRWSAATMVGERALLGAVPVAAGGDIVVLGTDPAGPGPTRIDLTALTSVRLADFPLATVIDQGAGWSGTQLFVCGGQRATTQTVGSTDAPGPVSADCALWTP